MSDPFDPDKASLPDAVVKRVGEACDRFAFRASEGVKFAVRGPPAGSPGRPWPRRWIPLCAAQSPT